MLPKNFIDGGKKNRKDSAIKFQFTRQIFQRKVDNNIKDHMTRYLLHKVENHSSIFNTNVQLFEFRGHFPCK